MTLLTDYFDSLRGRPVVVTKGCRPLGLGRGQKGHVCRIEFVENTGFRVRMEIQGRPVTLWTTNAARLKDGRFSLNTGDPTKRVVFSVTL